MVFAIVFMLCLVAGIIYNAVWVYREKRELEKKELERLEASRRNLESLIAQRNEMLAKAMAAKAQKSTEIMKEKVKLKPQTVEEKPKKLPVDLELIKYVPENKLGEVVNSLSLKYGLGATAVWAAIHEARKDVTPVVHTEDRVYREDFYGDDRERDVYLNDYELDELDDDERDELLEDLDDYERDELFMDIDDEHEDLNDYGHDSWGDNDY